MATFEITIANISKRMGSRTLFEEVTAVFKRGHRYGLTGPNGAGKSTLLKIMMGSVEANTGTVSLPEKVGFLRQNIDEFRDMLVVDAVIRGNERLWNAIQERNKLYEVEMTDAVGMLLAEFEEVIANEDGYAAESEAETLLEGMGIHSSFFGKTLSSIPIDLQFRVLLCQALFGKPDALLLDEPTNHLDLHSIGWLEEFLHKYEGILIVVSHDRHFLNAITTDIADIDYDTLIIYPGNYDAMIMAKTSSRERVEEANKSKEKKIAHLREFVSKFGAGTRASQVQSRVKEMRRLEPEELKKSNIQRPYIRFQNPEKMGGKIAFKIEGLCKGFEHPVISDFHLEIPRGAKIGVIGNNGIGKTTLLRMLAGVLDPDKGTIEPGHELSIGYFPQNHHELVKRSDEVTLFDWLKEKQDKAYDQEIRGVLGKMLFSGEEAFKKLSALSGGETARLILGMLMQKRVNTLILDEPNNHLDLEAVSALGIGLRDFPGTVLVASHDRDLLDTVCDHIIAIESNQIVYFDGSLEDYLSRHKTSSRS